MTNTIKAADNPFRNGIGGTVLMLDQSPILFDSGAGTGVRPALGNLLDNQGFLKNYLMSRGLLNSLNNRLDNLEWTTKSKNTRHAIDTGLINFDSISKPVVLEKDGVIYKFKSIKQAERELNIFNVGKLLSGKYKGETICGYKKI
mgnify:CR=1 FL=1